MNKQKNIETFKEFLAILAKRSTCKKIKVAALIVKEGRILSTGWNGAAPGLTHCSDYFNSTYPDIKNINPEEFSELHKTFSEKNELHAEANAIAFAAKCGISIAGAELYTTYSPCLGCAKLILASGLKSVYYINKYDRSADEAINLLKNVEVNVEQI